MNDLSAVTLPEAPDIAAQIPDLRSQETVSHSASPAKRPAASRYEHTLRSIMEFFETLESIADPVPAIPSHASPKKRLDALAGRFRELINEENISPAMAIPGKEARWSRIEQKISEAVDDVFPNSKERTGRLLTQGEREMREKMRKLAWTIGQAAYLDSPARTKGTTSEPLPASDKAEIAPPRTVVSTNNMRLNGRQKYPLTPYNAAMTAVAELFDDLESTSEPGISTSRHCPRALAGEFRKAVNPSDIAAASGQPMLSDPRRSGEWNDIVLRINGVINRSFGLPDQYGIADTSQTASPQDVEAAGNWKTLAVLTARTAYGKAIADITHGGGNAATR